MFPEIRIKVLSQSHYDLGLHKIYNTLNTTCITIKNTYLSGTHIKLENQQAFFMQRYNSSTDDNTAYYWGSSTGNNTIVAHTNRKINTGV